LYPNCLQLLYSDDNSNPLKLFLNLAKELSEIQPPIKTDDQALRLLISEDLNQIGNCQKTLTDDSLSISPETLYSDLDDYTTHLHSLGININKPHFEVVESFPPPFEKFVWSAFCPDEEDERRYGIKRGIYFRSKSIKPLYSRVLLAHELIHTIPGKRNPEILAMGLEEGLAELLGSLYLASRNVGSDVVRNIFIYSRHGNDISTLWKLYLDHSRQAALLYYKFGLEGLLELIKQGRKAIHDVESDILTGKINKINIPKGSHPEYLTKLVDHLLLAYLPNYTLKPLEAYLLKYVDEGKNVSDISKLAGVPEDLANKILSDVSGKTVLFVMDKDHIAYSNVNFYRQLAEHERIPILRYRID